MNLNHDRPITYEQLSSVKSGIWDGWLVVDGVVQPAEGKLQKIYSATRLRPWEFSSEVGRAWGAEVTL